MPPANTTSATRRRLASERLTHRKRAPIACQFCRLRKTRCDGVKPVCGFCQHHNAQCVWGATPDEIDSTPTEKEILRRLDELKELVSESRQAVSPINGAPQSLSIPQWQEIPHSPITVATQTSNLRPSAPEIAAFTHTSCESLMGWPIYRSVLDPNDIAVESLVLECGRELDDNDVVGATPSHGASQNRHIGGFGIQDHLIIPLCRKFLAEVHPRNPILDGSQLIHFAKHVAEHGLEWDAPSCLVLVACALACYTIPWDKADTAPGQAEHLKFEDVATAEVFYLAAKKRFGLLGWSLIDIQCLFFASVYEKYALNPLQAWFCIQQASSRLQAQLKRKMAQDHSHGRGYGIEQDNLLQRVFWSVYKAEYELLPELPFTSSGIEVFTRADSMFPSPPTLIAVDRGASSEQQDFAQEERSWAFYLAEISIRRTISDTIVTLYRKGQHYWLTHVQSMVQQCEECEKQVQLWYSHLPASIYFDVGAQPDNELSFFLQGRFYQWRGYILRPLLFYVLHRPPEEVLTTQIIACAQELMTVCADSIIHNSRHHRHGGTWFTCRGSFTSALLILGVVLKADPNLLPPSNWDTLIEVCVSTLQKWEAKSTEIKKLRVSLERLYIGVCREVGQSKFLI